MADLQAKIQAAADEMAAHRILMIVISIYIVDLGNRPSGDDAA
jgi:hypothetical protein